MSCGDIAFYITNSENTIQLCNGQIVNSKLPSAIPSGSNVKPKEICRGEIMSIVDTGDRHIVMCTADLPAKFIQMCKANLLKEKLSVRIENGVAWRCLEGIIEKIEMWGCYLRLTISQGAIE
jgi:hypothetical protein